VIVAQQKLRALSASPNDCISKLNFSHGLQLKLSGLPQKIARLTFSLTRDHLFHGRVIGSQAHRATPPSPNTRRNCIRPLDKQKPSFTKLGSSLPPRESDGLRKQLESHGRDTASLCFILQRSQRGSPVPESPVAPR
jgi:hypothetical protein